MTIFDWKRFWLPSGEDYGALLADDGFLIDPEEKYSFLNLPGLERQTLSIPVELQALVQLPCLALLGEAGMGKSTAVASYEALLAQQESSEEAQSLVVDVGSLISAMEFENSVFRSEAFASWKTGNSILHLVLDGWDETQLRIERSLIPRLRELRPELILRLRLRIACRAAVWNHAVTEGLTSIFSGVSLYNLLPLRKRDVIGAANAEGLDGHEFVRQVVGLGVSPLAVTPITLSLLLNSSKNQRSLPASKTALYRDGLLALVEEREDRQTESDLSAPQRLEAASILAATAILCGRTTIWRGPDRGRGGDGELCFQDIFSALHADRLSFSVNERDIREILASGLFMRSGDDRVRFAHRTFAEFLAATHLAKGTITTAQIISILVQPGRIGERIVPQLSGLAACLASLSLGVFDAILGIEPILLLDADLGNMSPGQRHAIVDALLRLHQEDESVRLDSSSTRHRLPLLCFDGLDQLLDAIVRDRGKSENARVLAARLIEACELISVTEALAEIAVDSTEMSRLRRIAAVAVGAAGSDGARNRLRPIALASADTDDSEALKGLALYAIWPRVAAVGEIFAALQPSVARDTIGDYYHFISHWMALHIKPEDLVLALQWVAKQEVRHYLWTPFDRLIDQVLELAWRHIDDAPIRLAMAQTLLLLIGKMQPIHSHPSEQASDFLRDDAKRRLLLIDLINLPEYDIDKHNHLLEQNHEGPALATVEDVPFLLEELGRTAEGRIRGGLLSLIGRLVWTSASPMFQALVNASHGKSELIALVERIRENDRRRLSEKREFDAKHQRRQVGLAKKEIAAHCQQVNTSLDSEADGLPASSDESEAPPRSPGMLWPRLCRLLQFGENDRVAVEDYRGCLTDMPGWQSANPSQQRAILTSADCFLREAVPSSEGDFVAGIIALHWFADLDDNWLQNLTPDIWTKWTPCLLVREWIMRYCKGDRLPQLFAIAYKHAPGRFLECVSEQIVAQDEERGHVQVLEAIQLVWDNRVTTVVNDLLAARTFSPQGQARVLDRLWLHDEAACRRIIGVVLASSHSDNDAQRERRVHLASVLLTHGSAQDWGQLWSFVTQDPEGGRQLLERSHFHALPFGGELTDQELADLFIWIRRIPKIETKVAADTAAPLIPPVSTFSNVDHLQSATISMLRSRGACEALERLQTEFPDEIWIRRIHREADSVARQDAWKPMEPDQLIAMERNQFARFVESADQLQQIVLESLGRLGEKMHAPLSPVFTYWDTPSIESPNGTVKICKPKDENHLSDCIVRHLIEDLRDRHLIVNREVDIRRVQAAHGERLDILIETFREGTTGLRLAKVSCTVEVKGSWNNGLKTSMRTQLCERYLLDNKCTHGIYLIGWFYCNRWTDESRKDDAASNGTDLSEMRVIYEAQAQERSRDGIRVDSMVLDLSLG